MNIQTISLQYNVKNSEKTNFQSCPLAMGRNQEDFVVVIQA